MNKSQMLEKAILTELKERNAKKNDIIPSRNQLALKYKCSRTTVERAIDSLKKQGFLSSVQGAPTRVLDLAARRTETITDLWLIAPELEVYTPARIREMFLPGMEEEIAIHTVSDDALLKQLDLLTSPGAALVWLMPKVNSIGMIDFFRKKNIPQLLINRDYSHYAYACTDTYESIREGLSWLMIESGRNLALVTKRPNLAQPYLAERLLAFYENSLKLGANLEPGALHIRSFADIPREMSEVGLQLFGSAACPRGIVVLDSALTLPLVTCGLVYGKHPGKDYYLLTYDVVPELANYAGIGMMRQQDEKLFLETKRWIIENFASTRQNFVSRIKTELIRPLS